MEVEIGTLSCLLQDIVRMTSAGYSCVALVYDIDCCPFLSIFTATYVTFLFKL